MNSGASDFETAICLTGYGRFHYALAACCALCLLSTGFQNGLNAYILPVAQCDLNLTSAQMGYLNTSFLVGGICSAFLWGLLGDLIGRRKVLVFTLLADWLVTMCAGLSQTFMALLVLRFINGFLIGAPGTLAYSYFAEFQPERVRAKSVCFIGMFFSVAWFILPALAWVIMPLPWELRLSGFIFNSWRLFIVLLSIPSLISGLWMFYLPESPKFLLTRGESKQALTILKHMFSVNTGESADNFQVKLLVNNKQIVDNTSDMKTVGRGRTARMIEDAKDQVKQLFQPPFLSLTVLTSAILFANMFGYLGLGLWLPEILSRFEEYNSLYPNNKITLCELQSFFQTEFDHTPENVTLIQESNFTKYDATESGPQRCENDMDGTVFVNTLVMGVCCIVGNIVSTYFAGILNHKVQPIFFMLVGAISAAGIYWLNTSLQHLIVASVFQTSMATANVVINSVVVNVFPTSVSAMAMCTAILSGRLGAVVSNLVLGFLLDKSCEIPLFVIVFTLFVGTALCVLIPSSSQQKQKEEHVLENYKSLSDISIISSKL